MRIVISAVTKAFDKYCIAGLTENGQWVRPIPNSFTTRFWEESDLRFGNKNDFLRSGDIIEFQGYEPTSFQHENHIEDIVVKDGKITFLRRYSNYELINFLVGKEDNRTIFQNTVHANGRSLCLVKPDQIRFEVTKYFDQPKKPKLVLNKQEFST